ncbi:MAG: MBL fold metallo-hydrolase [Anaerolineales bacterium]|nr:MBL fold metallo-hydrolase [Anaerolineales bacterium]
MSDALTIKFWGVRGSHPTPGAGTVKYGGNTACVEITAGNKTLILDAGTGIIPLGRDLARRATGQKRPLEVTLLFSHLHHDHTQGFPFFAPAYMPNAKLHIFGPGVSPEMLEKVLENNQSPTTFPVGLREMAAAKEIRSVRESQVIVWEKDEVRVVDAGTGLDDEALIVRIHKSHAHPGGVYVYRVDWRGQSIVYATDTEGYVGTDRRLVRFAHGADVLIHDAQYSEEHYHGQLADFPSTQGYGHSTARMACEVAATAGVEKLFLFHHNPAYEDSMIDEIEREAKAWFENTVAAYEGLEITSLTPGPSPTGRWVGEAPNSGVRGQWRVKYVQDG